MQNLNENNIIQLKSKGSGWKKYKHSDKILSLFDKTLYKNANIVDIETGKTRNCDILVQNGVVTKIADCGKIKKDDRTEAIELLESFVLPAFCDGFSAHDHVYGMNHLMTNTQKDLLRKLMEMKQLLSGVGYVFDTSDKNMLLIDNDFEFNEKTLTKLSNYLAQHQEVTLYLKIGQTLEELGSVDKKFGKPLVNVLEDFGILDRNFVLVGGNCFEKDDFQIFNQYTNRIVVCPTEDAQIGRRALNLCMLRNLGFDISIGSGKAFEVDFFAYMRQILSSQWTMFEDNTCLSEKDVLLFATNNTSRVKEGDLANFYVLEKDTSLYDDLLKSIVWGRSKKDVLFTVIEGHIVQQLGEIIVRDNGMDYFDIIKQIKTHKE